ncbi:MAG: von Willebrand factor type A domain-containing protein [Lachnospiraceae bacterium]|nr:von Willebrand factor type A domain-containing protein [Lachnospiraceae bacterium]
MKKRLVAYLLTMTLVAGMLTGCGGSKMEAADMSAPASEITSEETVTGMEYTTEEAYESEEAPAEEAKLADREEKENGYLESCYDIDVEAANGEEYSEWEEKGYSSVMKAPLSTFSADVDTASYSNLRRLIRDGYSLEELPEHAVRIEEMLNYFDYDYAEPKGNEPFGVTTQIGKCPWNQEAELVMIGLKTKEVDYEQAPASNLVFLLDVSGSMHNEDKLPLLQESFCMLAENLTEKDRVSIVTYAGDDTIVLDGVSGDKTRKIQKALNSLEAGGGTHGSKGIETAYALAEEYFIEGGNNRVILATDGDLNIGLTSEEELEELITEKKESGIFLSVLGFGTGNIKDSKMETLADEGNGNYAYIDCIREADKVLVEEMTATLLTICKDVKFQVEFNPSVVSSYRLIGYENRALNKEDFNDDTKDAGEIGAGHSVTVLYEVILKEPMDGLSEEDIEDLKYSDNYKKELEEQGKQEVKANSGDSNALTEEWFTLSIRYKKPAEDESNLLQYPVGYECYETEPSDDFRFAAAVAEFGLLASHSEYQEDASVKSVKKVLKNIDLDDEYKEEFLELVKECN